MSNIVEFGAEPLYIAEVTKENNLLGEGKIVRTNGRTLPRSTEEAVKTLIGLRCA